MCAVCGCGPRDVGAHVHDGLHVHSHDHLHGHDHGHEKVHDHAHGGEHGHPPAGRDTDGLHVRRISFEESLLAKNQAIADRNRRWLEERQVVALNLIGAPGAGKTTVLEGAIPALSPSIPSSVLEGDQETDLDAERIRALGVPVLQINTGSGCHLNAEMIGPKLRELAPPPGSLLFIENVGNLVCPSLFDVGERAKVVVMSVTEGEDKPLKYPHVFRVSEALILSKIDLLPHLRFDLQRCVERVKHVNPNIRIFPISTMDGAGSDELHAWLRSLVPHGARRVEASGWR